MKKEYFLGIDIGTQSIRAALIDINGRVIAIENIPQEMYNPKPGWAVQDPMFWWESTVKNIRSILKNVSADEIKSIGVCAHMHGAVSVDKEGNLLSHDVQLYCDKRSADIVEEYKNKPEIEWAFNKTANMPTSNWLGFKIKWLKENDEELYNKAHKFMVPKDYINFCFTGETVIDHSEAAGSFLMDAEKCEWSKDLIEFLELDYEKLPTICEASQVIGEVTEKAAQITGLKKGTLVVGGGGDMFCSLLTSGMTQVGRVSDVTGTGSIICFYSDKPIYDKRIMNLRHVIPGWVPFGCIDNSGGALRWFRDGFCQSEKEMANKKNIETYELLDEYASKISPAGDGLLFYPYLMGERTLGTPYAKGVFFGINPRHGKGDFLRAIMEGVAFEHKRTLNILKSSGHDITSIYHTGGGAKGDFWNQVKADIYQKPVCTLEESEGGVVGAAILGAVSVGAFTSAIEGAEKCTKIKKVYEPNLDYAEKYNYLFNIFEEVHDLLQKPFNKLAKMP